MYKMEEKFFTEGSGHMKINFLLTSSHIFSTKLQIPPFPTESTLLKEHARYFP